MKIGHSSMVVTEKNCRRVPEVAAAVAWKEEEKTFYVQRTYN